MNRKYAALYDADREIWKVIYCDSPSPVWYVFIPDAGDQLAAQDTADALNKLV